MKSAHHSHNAASCARFCYCFRSDWAAISPHFHPSFIVNSLHVAKRGISLVFCEHSALWLFLIWSEIHYKCLLLSHFWVCERIWYTNSYMEEIATTGYIKINQFSMTVALIGTEVMQKRYTWETRKLFLNLLGRLIIAYVCKWVATIQKKYFKLFNTDNALCLYLVIFSFLFFNSKLDLNF